MPGCLPWSGGCDGLAVEAPFEHALPQGAGSPAAGAQQPDGVGCQDAVGAPAVGDDFGACGQLAEPGGQFAQRDGHRAGDVAGGVFLSGPHVDDIYLAGFGPAEEFLAADRLGVVVAAQVGGAGGLGVGQVGARHLAQCPVQGGHVVAGQPVEHAGAVAAGGDQPGGVQRPHLGGGVADRHSGGGGERLDAALGLDEQVEQLQAGRVGQRLADAGELGEQRGLAFGGHEEDSTIQMCFRLLELGPASGPLLWRAGGRDAMTRIWPLAHEGLGNSSYLAEVADGLALAVDPGRDPRPYLSLAAAHGLRVAFTADTHVHADYVSGSRELAGLGAQLLAPAGSGLSFGHQELRGGQDLDLGGLTLQALATPGHTPEHLSYLLLDGAQPVAVFTGGALIVGGVARTDLAAPARAQEWTRAAYHSARALLGLPGDLAAYPTHGPGSFCSAGETGEHVTTIGREKAGNPLLASADEDSFTRQFLSGLGTYPAYFARMPAINRRGAPRHGTSRPVLPALTAAHVAELAAAGATIMDARPIGES